MLRYFLSLFDGILHRGLLADLQTQVWTEPWVDQLMSGWWVRKPL